MERGKMYSQNTEAFFPKLVFAQWREEKSQMDKKPTQGPPVLQATSKKVCRPEGGYPWGKNKPGEEGDEGKEGDEGTRPMSNGSKVSRDLWFLPSKVGAGEEE